MEVVDVKTTVNDYELAKANIKEYLELKENKAKIDTRMKELKAGLEVFSNANRELFKGNELDLDYGKLKFGMSAKVVTTRKFKITEFLKEFGGYVEHKLSVSMVKKGMQNTDVSKKLKSHGVKITQDEVLKIE